MTISECISKRIKQLLKEKGLSYYRLEMLTGISHSTLNCLLNNRYDACNIRTLFIIIEAIGISVSSFFDSDIFILENINID